MDTSPNSSLAGHFQALHDYSYPNRAAKLQNLCEIFWEVIDRNPHAASVHMDDFVSLLQNNDDLLLARLVIPELRPNTTPSLPQSDLKKELLRRIMPQRPSLSYLDPNSQAKYNEAQPLYKDEQAVLQEAEIYRTWILMCNRYEVKDEAEQQRVREWLDACPIKDKIKDRNRRG